MAEAIRDQNHVTNMLMESSTTPGLTLNVKGDEVTGRLLVDTASGAGTVTSVSVVTANGFAGSVANATTTPAITITTTVTGLLKGNGTAISAAVAGTDYTNRSFSTIVVAGQTDVTADNAADTLTLVAGTNITITTTGNQITINASGGAAGATTALDNLAAVAINAALVLGTSDAFALGSATKQWSDLFLAEGGVINWDNGDVTLTQTGNLLAVAGGDFAINGGLSLRLDNSLNNANFFIFNNGATGANAVTFTAFGTAEFIINDNSITITTVTPKTNDAAALGSASLSFSDLFLASGALINFANGNAVITHSSGIITVSTGDLRVTTAGTNTASVVTVGGTQTLTAKTLTSPTITTANLSGAQLLAEGASIALDPSLSADGTWSGITITGTSGYTQAFGDLVYLDPTDNRWEAADANAASGADGDARGMLAMVVVAATDGNTCTLLLQGVIRADANFPTFTVNNPIYVSETAGDVTQTQPVTTDVVIRIIGAALTADSMYFDPDKTWITHT